MLESGQAPFKYIPAEQEASEQRYSCIMLCMYVYIYRGGNTIQPNEVSSHVPTSFEEIGSQTQLDKIPSFLTVIGS